MSDLVFNPPLDAGIEHAVRLLCEHGIETYESCQGGVGHAYLEPTIRFHGNQTEGFKAFDIAQKNALPVSSISRIWTVIDGEPTGPYWQMVFSRMPICPDRQDVGTPHTKDDRQSRHDGSQFQCCCRCCNSCCCGGPAGHPASRSAKETLSP